LEKPQPPPLPDGISGVALADAILEIVWICDASGTPLYGNRAWSAFSGLTEATAPDRWLSAVHPDDLALYRRHVTARERLRLPAEFEFRLRRADGKYRRMRARIAPLPPGSGEGAWACTCTDVDDSTVSDPRLRRLFDSNVVGIVIANNAGAILEANQAFLETIGYSREDLERGAIDWRRLTPPEWLHLDEQAIAQMALDGVFPQYEKEYIRKDGTRVPISVGGARIDGTCDEQICYIVDLSAIRRAEDALRRSESRFQRLNDANVIGVIASRLSDGSIFEANDEFLRTIGYTREEFQAGRIRWPELTPPEWLPQSGAAAAEMRDFGRFTAFEKEYYRKDGSRVPVLIGGALLEGATDESVCYVLDLSRQREAMQQLQQSEQRYRALAEALPQIVMIADRARRLVYVNRHYEAYTGIPPNELAARWREPIHPDDLEVIDRARATGGPYEVEYRLRRASDGTFRWHFARCLEVPGIAGDAMWLATALDIDDRKRAEETRRFIETASSRLAQSLDLQTTFETMLDLVVPEFGDWASITLRDDNGAIKTIAARHRDPAKAELIDRITGIDYFSDSHSWGTAEVYRTAQPQLIANVSRDDMVAAVRAPFVPIFDALGFGSLVTLPIFSGTDVIGSFGIISEGPRRTYTAADLPALTELTRRAGFAIANARLYQREHRVASVLQEAALPRKLPAVAGFRFDGYYRAGRQEALIGGDWYDALVVADGSVVVSVGDVAGSGLQAAVLMGNVRQLVRGAAHVYANPMMMLDVADRTLRSEHEENMVTAFVGVIDPVRRTLLYASAGHLPALLRTPDGRITDLMAPGAPLGFRTMAPSESKTVLLPPNSCLLLYTDGLVEWSHNIVAGEALLHERFAAALHANAANPARALVDSILPAHGARDDVAVLMVTID
jgi:PAS domain S-box-containing protein